MTTDISTQAVEAMADKVLKAAGSSLSHYSMHKTREAILEAVRDVRRAAFEEAAKVCEEQMIIFASDQYATNQPLSSFGERFACSELAKTIRALIETTNEEK